MLGCNACIFGRQTSTGIFLDQAAPVTGGGKGMGEGMWGGGGEGGMEIGIKTLHPFHFSSFNTTQSSFAFENRGNIYRLLA